jgi:hypothetical protein
MRAARVLARLGLMAVLALTKPALAQTADCLSTTTAVNAIDMRVLVIAADGNEVVLPAIISVLRYIGIPFDVMIAKDQVLDAGVLCNPSAVGHGRYQGILLTTGSLGFEVSSGVYESAFTWEEWNLLWSYEAKYRVRQATFYTYPGGWPDTYGLIPPTAGVNTTNTPIQAMLTTTSVPGSGNPSGTQLFGDLKPTAPITISNAYTYLATAAPGASVTPLLVDASSNLLASINNYPDGRKNLALTADGNASLLHTLSLSYGIVNWVTKGLYLGQRVVNLTAQPDDLLIANDIWSPSANSDTTGITYRLTGNDYNKFRTWQANRNTRGPGNIVLEIPFNAVGSTTALPVEELFPATTDTLTPAVKANSGSFRWMSHTFTHQNLDSPTSYSQTLSELRQNDNAATRSLRLIGYQKDALITPDVSGLNNAEALRAMKDFGIRYVVSNTSILCGNRNETIPPRPCPLPNMGVRHDLEPTILMVPRYPANLFYNVCTPTQWVSEYNFLYRAFWGRDLTYQEVLGKESDVWLRYLLSFDLRPVMFHQPNMCAYDGTRSLLGDLIDATMAKFSAISVLPPQSRQLRQIGNLMDQRMQLAAALVPGAGASMSAKIIPGPVSSSIVLTNAGTTALTVPITGVNWASASSRETLGGQVTSKVVVAPSGGVLTVPGAPAW